MQLTGIHHLTAVTGNVAVNYDFYTRTLGMRLVKKTVNQDDLSAYHLFYADGLATPGTDLTFFDWPLPRERRGTHSIVRTGLRVGSHASLQWWAARFQQHKVSHAEITERDGRHVLDFEDPEGQRLSLVNDEGRGQAHPWEQSPVPADHQIRGLGPITISVPELAGTDRVLTGVMNMRAVRTYLRAPTAKSATHVYAMHEGGPAAELHVAVEAGLPVAQQGAGAVHHVAFRTPNPEEHEAWIARLSKLGIPSSGSVDRYYFRSVYFREPNGILFEIATDGPGFTADEPLESMGQNLALPPFLESRRGEIAAGLKPLESTP